MAIEAEDMVLTYMYKMLQVPTYYHPIFGLVSEVITEEVFQTISLQ